MTSSQKQSILYNDKHNNLIFPYNDFLITLCSVRINKKYLNILLKI